MFLNIFPPRDSYGYSNLSVSYSFFFSTTSFLRSLFRYRFPYHFPSSSIYFVSVLVLWPFGTKNHCNSQVIFLSPSKKQFLQYTPVEIACIRERLYYLKIMQGIIKVFWFDGEASKSQCSHFVAMAVHRDEDESLSFKPGRDKAVGVVDLYSVKTTDYILFSCKIFSYNKDRGIWGTTRPSLAVLPLHPDISWREENRRTLENTILIEFKL